MNRYQPPAARRRIPCAETQSPGQEWRQATWWETESSSDPRARFRRRKRISFHKLVSKNNSGSVWSKHPLINSRTPGAVILSAVFRPASGTKAREGPLHSAPPSTQSPLKSTAEAHRQNYRGFGGAIVRNGWVLRREPFAQRRTPLPQDDSGGRFKKATTRLGSS